MKIPYLLVVFIFALGCKSEIDQNVLPEKNLYKVSTTLSVFKPAGRELLEAIRSKEKFKSLEVIYNHGYELEFISTNKDKQKAITEIKEVLKFSKEWGANTKNQRYDSVSATLQNPISHSKEIVIECFIYK